MTSILRLTDGTYTVDLLGGPFYLSSWRPSVAQYKGGGVFVDSPLSEGRRIVYKKFANSVERFDIKQRAGNADEAAEYMGRLYNLIERASDYWLSDGVNDPVYLEVKSRDETKSRYAVIVSGGMPDYENPFSMPFMQPDCAAVQDNLILILERLHWQSSIPGTVDTLQASEQSIVDNLVEGGSFEQANLSQLWTEMNITGSDSVANASEQAYTGRQSVKLIGTTGADRGIYQDIVGLTSGKEYTITGKALMEDGVGSLVVYDGGGFTNGVRDDTDEQNVELITNQSFETNLTGWNISEWSGAVRSSTYAHNGTWSVRLQSDGNSLKRFYSDAFALSGLHPYVEMTFAFREITATITGPSLGYYARYGIEFFDVSGRPVGVDLVTETISTGLDGWHILSAAGLVTNTPGTPGTQRYPPYTARAYFEVVDLGGATIDVYVDYFSLAQKFAPTNFSESWDSLSVAKTAPAGGSIRVAVVSKSAFGATGYFDNIRLERDFGTSILEYDKAFLANYQADGNLTHVYVDSDGAGVGSFTSNLLDSSTPYDLLPTAPAALDAIYFGSTHGPFASILLDLSSVASGYSVYGITWQYCYDATGNNWTTLEPQDNTEDFTVSGRNAVVWRVPSDWEKETVNGVEAWWIRARIDAGFTASTWLPPSQQRTHPHIIEHPYFEFDASAVGGDLNTLVKYAITHEGSPIREYYSLNIATGVDDVFFDDDPGVKTIATGGSTAPLAADTTIGLRFQNVVIPVGAKIVYAGLTVTPGGYTVPVPPKSFHVRIHGHDHANSGAWSTWADGDGRTRTSAYTDRASNDIIWGIFEDAPFPFADLTEIVQEIVNRSDWTDAAAAMSFFITDLSIGASDIFEFNMYETAASSWELYIMYFDTDAFATTLFMGSRKTDRGEDFRSHLNFSEVQPASVTLSLGENTGFQSGQAVDWGVAVSRNRLVEVANLDNEPGVFRDRGVFRIHAPMSGSFNGRFRAFVRTYHETQATKGTKLRLRVATGAGGVSYYGDTFFGRYDEVEAVDLGLVTIPEIGTVDYIEIAVQALREDASKFYLFDLVLIPIDEWSVELSSMAKSTYGMLDGETKLIVDGITPVIGAEFMRALLVKKSDGNTRAEFVHSGARPALDNRATQRVYCLTVTDRGLGTGINQVINASLSNAVLGVEASAVHRYLGLRGNR